MWTKGREEVVERGGCACGQLSVPGPPGEHRACSAAWPEPDNIEHGAGDSLAADRRRFL